MKTKKVICVIVSMLMVATLLTPLTCSEAVKAAEKLTYQDWEYQELEDGTVEIVKYNGNEDELVIPKDIDGKRVTSIGYQAFMWCASTSIEIPLGITSIGDSAFSGCSSLINIEIPSSVTNIAFTAFQGCSGLTTIEIPSGVTSIRSCTFLECSSLTSIIVGAESSKYSSVDGVLYNKDKTEIIRCPEGKKGKFTIPSGVTSIGDDAFWGCDNLTAIEIPSNVTSIGPSAFMETNLTIYGEADSYAQQYAKEYNIKFVAVSIPEEPTPEKPTTPVVIAPKVGESFKDTKSKGQYKITGKQTVSYIKTTATSGKVTVPATVKYKGKTFKVTAIYKGAFKNKTGITAVTFGKNITSVGSEAFSGCKKLKTVTLNAGLTKIGDKAFYNCKALTQIKLGSKVTTIGKSAFAGCTKLKKVTLGTGLTTIGNTAFNKCTALTSITIPKNVKKIGKQAFYGCKNLKSITINTTKLKSSNVGANAFKGIYSKAAIKVPKSKKAVYQKLLKSKGAGKNVKYK
ncbi:MAG: leucine-rich repeat domain-containing protein [Lachnospiraceae bacterium]|nr:leucine-rich repeat domain-containing protein [Lachnospiraceae bacterium]